MSKIMIADLSEFGSAAVGFGTTLEDLNTEKILKLGITGMSSDFKMYLFLANFNIYYSSSIIFAYFKFYP